MSGQNVFQWATWWRHQMETFSALLAICAGNSPVPGEFPAQRAVMRSFYVFFDLRLNERLSKQSWGWWFEMLSCPLWRHCNGVATFPDSPVSCIISIPHISHNIKLLILLKLIKLAWSTILRKIWFYNLWLYLVKHINFAKQIAGNTCTCIYASIIGIKVTSYDWNE